MPALKPNKQTKNVDVNNSCTAELMICLCGSKEDMEHILNCDILNEGRKHDLKYEQLYKGTISEQLEVFRIFENSLERREMLKKIPCDPLCDPLISVMG